MTDQLEKLVLLGQENDALRKRLEELEQERNAWPVQIFTHKYLDPSCMETGCQSLLLKKRLEKCEAALAMYRQEHDYDLGPQGLAEPCRCSACDAARAVEEN